MKALMDEFKSQSRGCAFVLHRLAYRHFPFSHNYYGKGCIDLFAQPFIQPAPNKVCDTTCTVPRHSLSRSQSIITWLELFLAYVQNCTSSCVHFAVILLLSQLQIFFFSACPFSYKTSAINLPTKHQFSSILP